MRTLTVIICAVGLLAGTMVAAQELGDTRVYEAQLVTQRPVIDGRLDDACWQTALPTGGFVRVLKGPEEPVPTLFQVAYDDASLFIAVTCLEPNPSGIRAEVRTDDLSAVMGDDAVEIFLHPRLDEPTYYQLAANSVGARYDGRAFDPTWNADWQAAGSVGEDAWYLECAVSFASLGALGAPGATWGLNVNRDRQAGGDTEWSGWSNTQSGFHVPERFGRLVFGGTATGVNRSLIIECARYAARSIALEDRLTGDLAKWRTGAELLEPDKRTAAAPVIERAEAALAALRAFGEAGEPLDLRGWTRVVAQLETAAAEMGEVAWQIKFAELLADE